MGKKMGSAVIPVGSHDRIPFVTEIMALERIDVSRRGGEVKEEH